MTLAFPFTVGLAYNTQHREKEQILYLCAAFMGFFGFPVLPVALDLSAEITYPIPADFTSALLWCGSQVRLQVSQNPLYLRDSRYIHCTWSLKKLKARRKSANKSNGTAYRLYLVPERSMLY